MTQNWRYVTNCWDLKWFCTLNVVSFVKMLHGIVPSVLEESEDFLSISVWITTSVSHLWISHIGLGYKSILCCSNYILDLRWHVVIIIIISSSSSSIKLVEGECAMLLGSLYIRLSYKYTQPVPLLFPTNIPSYWTAYKLPSIMSLWFLTVTWKVVKLSSALAPNSYSDGEPQVTLSMVWCCG